MCQIVIRKEEYLLTLIEASCILISRMSFCLGDRIFILLFVRLSNDACSFKCGWIQKQGWLQDPVFFFFLSEATRSDKMKNKFLNNKK